MNPWWVLFALVVVVVVVWQVRRALGEPLDCDRIIAEALASTEPLIGTAVQDDLELLWNLPAYGEDIDAGCDRLWDALHDHREEETP